MLIYTDLIKLEESIKVEIISSLYWLMWKRHVISITSFLLYQISPGQGQFVRA